MYKRIEIGTVFVVDTATGAVVSQDDFQKETKIPRLTRKLPRGYVKTGRAGYEGFLLDRLIEISKNPGRLALYRLARNDAYQRTSKNLFMTRRKRETANKLFKEWSDQWLNMEW